MINSTRPGSLPAELSSFVGRRQELTEVRALLPKTRLLTLTGPGGVGKTRMALRAAAQFQRATSFRDGVWLVELGSVTERSVADTVAGVLRVPEQSAREPERALAEFLAGRELLLVMDNCEHVSAAVAQLLSELLSRAPGLQVLATSQEVLGVPGELVYRVEPLSVPGDGDPAAASSPAVALFLERAAALAQGQQVRPDDMAAIVEVCRHLDGIPLAIELAAAQLSVLAPSDLVARIDDRFRLLDRRSGWPVPRHATLRAAVGWSYDLCDKPERLVWQRLSIFAGELDVPRAVAVCSGHGLTEADVEHAVWGLVHKSVLISRREPDRVRLRMLETLRHYGLSRLAEEESEAPADPLTEVELRGRHLELYAEIAERFEEGWFGPGQAERLRQMREDLPDITAALRFAVDHPEHARTGLRMAGALLFFWNTVAVREGCTLLRRLVEVDQEPSKERARALSALAWLQWTVGNKAAGLPAARESLQLTRRLDPDRLPRVLHNVGMPLFALGDPEGAERMEESLALCRERGIGGEELAYALFPLALSSGFRGETERADALFDESIELCRAAGDNWWLEVTQVAAAWVAWSRGDLDQADAHAVEGLRTCRLVTDLTTMAQGLTVLALARVERRTAQAAALLGSGDRYWADAGGSVFDQTESAERVQEARDRCRAILGDAAYDAAYRRGWEHPLEEAVADALGVDDAPQRVGGDSSKDHWGLTPRELEIAALVAEGLSNRAIADRLVLSTRTVETHVQNILVKTGFDNRSMVAAWFAAHERT